MFCTLSGHFVYVSEIYLFFHTFQLSLGWALRFCKRYPELLQTIPDITIPLPTTMETKVETFKNNLLSYIKEGNIALENIVSMDEIPLHFLLTGK